MKVAEAWRKEVGVAEIGSRTMKKHTKDKY